jgi:hypothetical protein
MSWDKEQWGVFLIFTGFLIPLGIVFLLQSRRNSKHSIDTIYQRTFINNYDKENII